MPRKQPMPQSEMVICDRLKQFREFTGLSQAEFAALAGIKPNAYLGYEYKRAQLNYPAAWKILCRWPWLNPQWLAGESKTMLDLNFTIYPRPDQIKHGPRASFSDVYKLVLKPILLKAKTAWLIGPDKRFPHFRLISDAAGRFNGKEFIGLALLNSLAFLPDEKVNQFLDELLSFIGGLGSKYPNNTDTERGVLMFKEMLRLQSKSTIGSIRAAEKAQNILTNSSTSSNVADVKVQPQWPALKKRIQEATAKAGYKSKLANFLKVDLTRVSQWLSDSKTAREPGAEYALQMLYWVEQQERQK